MSGLWEFARHFASSEGDTVVCPEGVLHTVGETSLLHYLLESSPAPPSAQLGTALSAWDLYKKSYDEIEPSFKKSPRASFHPEPCSAWSGVGTKMRPARLKAEECLECGTRLDSDAKHAKMIEKSFQLVTCF